MANCRTSMRLGSSTTAPIFVLFAADRSANFVAPPAVDRADYAHGLQATRPVHGPKPRPHLGSHERKARLAPDFHLQSIHLLYLFSSHSSAIRPSLRPSCPARPNTTLNSDAASLINIPLKHSGFLVSLHRAAIGSAG